MQEIIKDPFIILENEAAIIITGIKTDNHELEKVLTLPQRRLLQERLQLF